MIFWQASKHFLFQCSTTFSYTGKEGHGFGHLGRNKLSFLLLICLFLLLLWFCLCFVVVSVCVRVCVCFDGRGCLCVLFLRTPCICAQTEPPVSSKRKKNSEAQLVVKLIWRQTKAEDMFLLFHSFSSHNHIPHFKNRRAIIVESRAVTLTKGDVWTFAEQTHLWYLRKTSRLHQICRIHNLHTWYRNKWSNWCRCEKIFN